MKNWKTSLSGIASIISGVALYINHPEQVAEAIGLVTLGIGLLFAKDASNTSKESETPIFGNRPNDR